MLLNPINILLIVLKGLFVGIVVSAPMGPVGVLTVRRTLNKGRRYGLVTGLGAAVSDISYALVTALFMSVVLNFFAREPMVHYFRLGGVVILFLFGLYSFLATPRALEHPSKGMGTLSHNMLTGFLVAVTNPLVILLFIALFDSVDFIKPEYGLEYVFGFVAIAMGACLWWFCLTGAIDKVRTRFDMNRIALLNKAIGVLVMLAAVAGLIHTLFYFKD